MSLRRFSFLCLALIALFVLSAPFARAEEEHDGDNEDGGSDDATQVRRVRYTPEELAAAQAAQQQQQAGAGYIEADWVFPDHADLKFHAGEPAQLAVTITNTGETPFTILYARGTLYYNQDSNYSIENYTVGIYELVVNPTEQRSVQYYFTPHQMLDVGEYGLYTRLYYSDVANVNYTVTFFNRTIEIVEPESKLDADYLLKLGTVGASVLLAAFLVFRSTTANDSKRKSEYQTFTPSGTDADWLAHTSASQTPTKSKKAGTPSR